MPRTPHRPRRIGVFGGTFDPPHLAHLVVAVEVRDALDLDVVLLVVANDPWQKTDTRCITPAAVRLEMVRAAVADEPGLEASDLEIVRGGPSYSVDTMEELRRRHPDAELYLVLGADAAAGLDTWHRHRDLLALCELVVVGRPGTVPSLPEGTSAVQVEVPQLEVSASDLRARVAAGRSIRYLVPDPVISLIREHRLYGGPR
ncbi:MAG TPA: nicotinate-nucleotide adenylyltransferase [Microthrixaceae bacterium]|nr:nicotinate-nucleotide adenylyltransferase [Microthrixaceae bacterium]